MSLINNMTNTHKITIALLVLLLIWFGLTIIRLENAHYANFLGMCDKEGVVYNTNPQALIERDQCSQAAETRTSGIWHLYYALFDK